ncbi:MAG: hypothetical protein Q4P18_01095 [Methanobrevibacter sp.]|uniref:hypothetical protein n=1 Tax=Methanobrevibacter sp. TaxID=66852 RepID=UPI0026DF7FEA|nr:hypothetical protein [Methanobrevibacter sp.]MDO5848110.1 hypothetical protein [Methanobrevibacter sp.]
MNSFVDTNVPISYCFNLDPFNRKSETIFKKYQNIYWSNTVLNEFKKTLNNKKNALRKFYTEFLIHLKKCSHFYEHQIEEYISSLKMSKKSLKHFKTSLILFWQIYIEERFPQIEMVKRSVEDLLIELNIIPYKNRKKLIEIIKTTPKRIESYENLLNKINELGVHYPDNEILLDAYDFNMNYCKALDFITFDLKCYEAASEIREFLFNEAKGIYDFW